MVWKVEQGCNLVRGNKLLEVESGETEILKHTTDDQKKQVCDVEATTPSSYTLYFFVHVVIEFFIRERLDNFKN